MGKEIQLYNILINKNFKSETRASYLVDAVVKSRSDINFSQLRREKYNLIKEVKETNAKLNKNFDIASSIMYQIPHFSCKNIFIKKEYQSDISRYVLSSEHNIPAYKGSYGEQPSIWIQKLFNISSILREIEKVNIKKASNVKGINNGN